jgi:hypothetical protein
MNSSTENPDLLQLFVRPLHDAHLRYLVGGSVAAMHYSEPRYTIDVDIPILITPADTQIITRIFASPDYYCPPDEVIAVETNRECNGHFNIIHSRTGLKADFYPSNRDIFFGWAWKNRHLETTLHGEVYIAPPEFVILWKLEYFRLGGSEKHSRDISRMLEMQKERIDWEFLDHAVATRGLADVLRSIYSA